MYFCLYSCFSSTDELCSVTKVAECGKNATEEGPFDPIIHCPIVMDYSLCIEPLKKCQGQVGEMVAEAVQKSAVFMTLCDGNNDNFPSPTTTQSSYSGLYTNTIGGDNVLKRQWLYINKDAEVPI